ncbi:hypothetical protein HFP89_08405 [Wenzhouxiangella sp. XN79A]|uniref:DUF5808 domain-containing protein n=1 Tax=Wenzhouxiangella sp. XN79A TaxID=2724193 RepID=UPI00144A8405|nr:DUF5808 domain-containing protein [Wenzhouxiangella sp. XN79A]NKI35186.1 hypothetical protein [Wenzhouxiangella sp. XN79A]
MTLWMFGSAYLVPLAIGGLMLAMPGLSRGSTFFAVTVPAGFAESDLGQAIRRRYLAGVIAATLIALAAVSIIVTPITGGLAPEPAMTVAHTVAVLIITFGALGTFLHCRGRALAFRRSDQARRAIELLPPDRLVDVVPRPLGLHLLPYLPVLGAIAWLAARGPIPAPDGAPIGFAATYGAPLSMLGTLVLMHLVMPMALLIRRLPGHRSRVRAINRMLLWMMVCCGLLGGWISLGVLYGERWITGGPGATVQILLILGLLAVPLVMRWRGRFDRPGHPDEGDRSPDAAWKLGMVYFNPDDPALWLEKRFGVGYTLNFGRPMAWVIVLGLLGASVLMIAVAVVAVR